MAEIEIDHVRTISSSDESNDEEVREPYSWQNNQPLLKKVQRLKGIKFDFLTYRSQFIKN